MISDEPTDRRRRSTWYAIVLDAPQGRIAVPCGVDDTAEVIEKRFEEMVKDWYWSVRLIVRENFLERLEDFRKRGLEALDRQVAAIEYGD